MLLRLAYLGVTNMFAMLRLLPTSDRNKDIEILALRHQIMVPQRQIGGQGPRFAPSDRATSSPASSRSHPAIRSHMHTPLSLDPPI
ncbi:hypothetical protein [Micromonospora sp. U56]|uniref:hypothetical protein n=1 Tax=Micromonospora sp. U56 TaxID=2824900 RepID=UPI001FFCE603|nr:hypothetical protein [Micromonospora sp. U56]